MVASHDKVDVEIESKHVKNFKQFDRVVLCLFDLIIFKIGLFLCIYLFFLIFVSHEIRNYNRLQLLSSYVLNIRFVCLSRCFLFRIIQFLLYFAIV